MKTNRAVLIAAIVLSNVASNAFAVIRPPYPPDRIITIGGYEQFQTQNTNSTVVGARNAKQVEGNVDAAALRLTTKEITEIEGKNEREPELVTAA
jgi:hypothetical protein